MDAPPASQDNTSAACSICGTDLSLFNRKEVTDNEVKYEWDSCPNCSGIGGTLTYGYDGGGVMNSTGDIDWKTR